jgi:hypothetical protein
MQHHNQLQAFQVAVDAEAAALAALSVFNQQQTAWADQGQPWCTGDACVTPSACFGPAMSAAAHSTTTTQTTTHLALTFGQSVFDAAGLLAAQGAGQLHNAALSPATLTAVAASQQAVLRTPVAEGGRSAQVPAACIVPAAQCPAAVGAAGAAPPAAIPGLLRSVVTAAGGGGGSAALLRGTLSRNGSVASGAAGAVLQATPSIGLLPPSSSTLSEEAGPDRQATLSTLQALLWEAEANFHKAEEFKEQLKKWVIWECHSASAVLVLHPRVA